MKRIVSTQVPSSSVREGTMEAVLDRSLVKAFAASAGVGDMIGVSSSGVGTSAP